MSTPYGTVVASMALPIAELPEWKYCNPLALLHYLCTISVQFAQMMQSCSTVGVPLKLIIYIDEICPGNPLRMDKARTLQAIYWAFADWPQWFLQRTAAWPCFGTIRSTLVDKLPGKVSQLMKIVLDTFFAATGPSFARGVAIQCQTSTTIITATFSGFLADEKAHNQITGSKGAAGTTLLCKHI